MAIVFKGSIPARGALSAPSMSRAMLRRVKPARKAGSHKVSSQPRRSGVVLRPIALPCLVPDGVFLHGAICSMAVPKRKTSPMKRGFRRSADALAQPTYVEDKDSGELRRPHHVDLKSGMYRGRMVLKPKAQATDAE